MASTIYEQIVQDIRFKINRGALKPGGMIPSESSLCREYNTTRMTVRKALALLTEGGYIYSVSGKGSFVCEPDHNRHILHFNEKQKTVVIRRLSYSQREPFAYDIKYLPYDKGKPIVEEVIQYATFPEIVAARMSLFSVKNELTIWVKKAQGEEIKFLKTEEGHPLMVIEQKLFDDGNKPVGWGKIYFRGEYCHLHAVSSFSDRTKRAL
ncbi:MAG: GntR family transcriptional regulator [Clostridiales bacterium]|nr:GntR family transcriptional regulator [Eubacteriales bacterium]MDH7567409.1 GntR family transcriptional regulator [Clostridiales bacterium]